jgi:hypothetical protein
MVSCLERTLLERRAPGNILLTTAPGSAGIEWTGFNPVTQVAIRDTVYLFTHNGEGSFADIDSIDFAAPEPATLGMVGLALGGA